MDKITKKLRGCAWQQLERVEGETLGGGDGYEGCVRTRMEAGRPGEESEVKGQYGFEERDGAQGRKCVHA